MSRAVIARQDIHTFTPFDLLATAPPLRLSLPFSKLPDEDTHSPSQVVRTALVDAASVSSLITTSECVIAEAPEDKKSAGPAMPSPDMY